MFVQELRDIAMAKNKISNDQDIHDAVIFLKNKAKIKASQGKFELVYEVSKLPFEPLILDKALINLRNLGLHCEIKEEITAQYSNTDWDTEAYLTISL